MKHLLITYFAFVALFLCAIGLAKCNAQETDTNSYRITKEPRCSEYITVPARHKVTRADVRNAYDQYANETNPKAKRDKFLYWQQLKSVRNERRRGKLILSTLL